MAWNPETTTQGGLKAILSEEYVRNVLQRVQYCE